MGRLTFVGLGLGSKGVSLEGLEELRQADTVYLEYYTTPHEPGLIKTLEEASGKTLNVVDRLSVEDGSRFLEEAGAKRVVLAVPGDPMIATTHTELRVRAIMKGIETRVVHAATIGSAAASASGLHWYKFSRVATITREEVGRITQAYHLLHSNLLAGAHTLFLLEYDVSSGETVTPGAALSGLLKAESNFKRDVLDSETFVLVLSRVGRGNPGFVGGRAGDLSAMDFGEPPHSLIVPGSLHFSESEAISAIFSIPQPSVRGNSDRVPRTAQALIPRYVAKTRKAMESLRGKVGKEYDPVLENAELYARDAESFLANGEDELAMLSIGYAEGLLDSLSFAGVAEIDWG